MQWWVCGVASSGEKVDLLKWLRAVCCVRGGGMQVLIEKDDILRSVQRGGAVGGGKRKVSRWASLRVRREVSARREASTLLLNGEQLHCSDPLRHRSIGTVPVTL
jgi:hypothetical protein